MKSTLLIAACVILAACHDSTNPPTAVIPDIKVPAPTYVVFGIVHNESGSAIFGAEAIVIGGKYAGRVAFSNAEGYFSFTGVDGELTIRVFHPNYERVFKTLTVSADVVLDLRLEAITVISGDSIRLGETIRSSVLSNAAPCDPIGWDARAPCKKFQFTAPRSGLLVIAVSWQGDPELDISMVVPPNSYVNSSWSGSTHEAELSAEVVAGVIYEIRVNAYYGGQDFNLRVDLTAP